MSNIPSYMKNIRVALAVVFIWLFLEGIDCSNNAPLAPAAGSNRTLSAFVELDEKSPAEASSLKTLQIIPSK